MDSQKPRSTSSSEKDLVKAVGSLNQFLAHARRDMRMYLSYRHSIVRSFLKGIMSGLGAFVAVAIATPIVILLLRGVQWPPIIGKIVDTILIQIEQSRVHLPARVDDQ